MYQTLQYEENHFVVTVRLNRPEKKNSLNAQMRHELGQLFREIAEKPHVRVLIITGNEEIFCAGADINWLKEVKNFTYEESLKETLELGKLVHRIYSLPQPTIARVNGAAIGGGTGLVAVCDLSIAAKRAQFSFGEVKIGVIPACISPYILRRVGEKVCREFFLTGERLTADRAFEAGLINEVVEEDQLDQAVERRIEQLLTGGPKAIAACKSLLREVPEMGLEEAVTYTARLLADLRKGEEAQEGMAAFLEKRKPKW
ncbi:enoyl-CoA hydratase/isomerase family protein [candidate division TA06 bacterium]|nr:enoyl-CoA hydratase/isomerase family protein [candidate division TA06 bacterium]